MSEDAPRRRRRSIAQDFAEARDRDRRFLCLQFAAKRLGVGASAEAIAKDAECFVNFVESDPVAD